MRLRRAFAASSLSVRRLMPKSALALIASASLLTACGGGGGSGKIDWQTAFQVIGHTDFMKTSTNDGQSTPQGYTLATPFGNVGTDGTKLYVADTANNRVLVWPSIPNTNGQAATVVIGQTDLTSKSSGTTSTKLSSPSTAFLSASGQLVVADTGNNRVLIWNTAPTTQAQANTAPDVIVGDGGSGVTGHTLNGPTSAIIVNNKLIVCDTYNNRVLVWNSVPTSTTQDASIVLGQASFTTNGDDDDAKSMFQPNSVWSDGAQLLVADTGNYRVLYWRTFPQVTAGPATNVVGQTDFSRSTYSTSASTFVSPTGVTSDGAQFWVADRGSNRVLKFDSMPASNGLSASLVYGQGDLSFTSSAANDDNQDGKTDNDDSDQKNGAATEHTLNGPTGVYVEGGVLYITDRSNSRVEMYIP
ncbi:NHL repeat-containing protein [Solimonas terrae]|uniref:NHL repeat containing protein n=1 Tax=Solimonas terrae TaxID=1396819 RepID=A0A6M2BYP7_9GAMM|nr:NHL repeat-containing protein [Solimonas terrae]NGY06949.1 hypothetical protein [Solimonas terrae]